MYPPSVLSGYSSARVSCCHGYLRVNTRQGWVADMYLRLSKDAFEVNITSSLIWAAVSRVLVWTGKNWHCVWRKGPNPADLNCRQLAISMTLG
jgi:hypothetical protein